MRSCDEYWQAGGLTKMDGNHNGIFLQPSVLVHKEDDLISALSFCWEIKSFDGKMSKKSTLSQVFFCGSQILKSWERYIAFYLSLHISSREIISKLITLKSFFLIFKKPITSSSNFTNGWLLMDRFDSNLFIFHPEGNSFLQY